MTTLREAAQQALEALEKLVVGSEYEEAVEAERAMDALKTALAEPVREPMAWLRLRDGKLAVADGGNFGNDWMPLYTAPHGIGGQDES